MKKAFIILTFLSFMAKGRAQIAEIRIGTQKWMIKNLDVVTYRNGDPIPQVTDPMAWVTLKTGAWCYYNNSKDTFGFTYGKLYNWYAVNDPRGLAPAGWHIPSDAEWTTLVNSLGGSSPGGMMKEAGVIHWKAPNTGGNNSSGWTGLPGGSRFEYGTFDNIGIYGHWWSSSEEDAAYAFAYSMKNSMDFLGSGSLHKRSGLSVRCLRD